MRYLFEEYAFDTDRRELHRGADVVSVAPQVFDLLDYLIRNRERVVSKDDLISAIWNGRIVSDAALTTRLNVARSAIGDTGEEQRLIKTLPRKGFRFVGTVREAQGPAGAAVADNPVEPPKPALPLPDKPSIAVLPFTNMSSDPEQEYFADGMVEDIITGTVAVQIAFRHRATTPALLTRAKPSISSRSGVNLAFAMCSKAVSARLAIASALVDSSSMPQQERIFGQTGSTARSKIFSICRIRMTSSVIGAICLNLNAPKSSVLSASRPRAYRLTTTTFAPSPAITASPEKQIWRR